MIDCIELKQFLEAPGVLIDARSPGEFRQSLIPTAWNLPILDDAQRALVGTAYKQQGHDSAVKLGFELVTPSFDDKIETAQARLGSEPAKIYCWRGGLRSGNLSLLLQSAGIPSVVLKGGYKAFRKESLRVLDLPLKLRVIGGLTGSGKTEILHALRDRGEQIIDLEALANHRGSSFGMLGMPAQPSCEQYENLLAWELSKLDLTRPIWIEDESRMVGACKLPNHLYDMMQKSPIFVVKRQLEERLSIIKADYGWHSPELLIKSVQRIERKLGGQRTRQVIELIEAGEIEKWISLVLEYYDRTYSRHLQKRANVEATLTLQDGAPSDYAQELSCIASTSRSTSVQATALAASASRL